VLLVGERYGQYLREPMAHPRRIVEPHGEVHIHLAELRQHRAEQLRQALVPRRHGDAGLDAEPFDFAEMKPVRLAAAREDSKSLPSDAGEPQKAIRQLVKIHDLGPRPHVVEVGFREAHLVSLADRHHAKSLPLAHATADHVVIARLEYAKRQGSVWKQHEIERE